MLIMLSQKIIAFRWIFLLDNFLDGFINKLRKELEAVEETYIDLDLLVFDRDDIVGECSAKADTLTDDYIQPTADEIITLVISYEDLIKDLEHVNAYNKNYLGR